MSGLDLDLGAYQVVVAVATFLAAIHAWTKLSPEFAGSWFGAGLVFGWSWAPRGAGPEAVLLPVLVVYEAAAVTKGLVETRDRVRGNHVVHVIMTGLLSAVLALPWEAAARAAGWPRPRTPGRELWGVPADALGGVGLDTVALWTILGGLFYGAFKVVDHSGLPRGLQVLVLFGGVPFLPRAVDALHGML